MCIYSLRNEPEHHRCLACFISLFSISFILHPWLQLLWWLPFSSAGPLSTPRDFSTSTPKTRRITAKSTRKCFSLQVANHHANNGWCMSKSELSKYLISLIHIDYPHQGVFTFSLPPSIRYCTTSCRCATGRRSAKPFAVGSPLPVAIITITSDTLQIGQFYGGILLYYPHGRPIC